MPRARTAVPKLVGKFLKRPHFASYSSPIHSTQRFQVGAGWDVRVSDSPIQVLPEVDDYTKYKRA